MTFQQIISAIISLFLVIGAIDHFFKDRLGLGNKIQSGLETFAVLIVIMGGTIALTPTLAMLCGHLAKWICTPLGIDPGILPGFILPNDSGGYILSKAMCHSESLGDLGGMIIGSTLGATLTGCIPPAFAIAKKEEHPYIVRGAIYGFLVTPISSLAGGMMLHIPMLTLLKQLLPLIVASALLAFLFAKYTERVVKSVIILGQTINMLAFLGLIIAIILHLNGLENKCAAYVTPLTGILSLIGSVIVTLAGAYVMAEAIIKVFSRPLEKLGAKIGCNGTTVAAMIIALANAIPAFSMLKNMPPKGKIIAFAFIYGAAFSLGDHLAFCTATAPQLLPAMLFNKILCGLLAASLALVATRYAQLPAPPKTSNSSD